MINVTLSIIWLYVTMIEQKQNGEIRAIQGNTKLRPGSHASEVWYKAT